MNNSYIYIYHVNVTQTVPDISPLMPMHQDPLLVNTFQAKCYQHLTPFLVHDALMNALNIDKVLLKGGGGIKALISRLV